MYTVRQPDIRQYNMSERETAGRDGRVQPEREREREGAAAKPPEVMVKSPDVMVLPPPTHRP